ncbi:hypothetical protein PPACK8108_LOCUS3363 [Phakopsora pachyrhizi]|uniref:Uncharacterized protein n=1 Tax=Phakopsora pachyrhizi TaxID=170000 RepID=A0AAV0AJU5_PHAPC|nr:hypothetical protein PPACK8108_LOCUS3363 [Phakopsora pachyrhizi]
MCKQAGKISKTQIVFKIDGLTEENFAYAQQEIQVVIQQNPGDTYLFYIQRLTHASVLSLGFQSSHILSNNLLLNSSTQSQLALKLLIFGSGLGLGLAVVELVDDSFRYQQFRLFDADVCRVR